MDQLPLTGPSKESETLRRCLTSGRGPAFGKSKYYRNLRRKVEAGLMNI